MPSNIIKTSTDEKKWKKAKKIAKKRGSSKNWALVVHIFQQMKKVEAKNTNFKNQIIDKNKIKLIKDEMRKAAANTLYNKILNIKSILQKNNDNLNEEFYAFDHLGRPLCEGRPVTKDFLDKFFTPDQQKEFTFTPVGSKSEKTFAEEKEEKPWEPIKPFNEEDYNKMIPFIEAGYDLREAAHMADIESPSWDKIRITQPSPAMLDHLKFIAPSIVHNYEIDRAETLNPVNNPELFLNEHQKELSSELIPNSQKTIQSLQDLFQSEDFKNATLDEQIQMEENLKDELESESKRDQLVNEISEKIKQKKEEVKRAHRDNLREIERNTVLGDAPIQDYSSASTTGATKDENLSNTWTHSDDAGNDQEHYEKAASHPKISSDDLKTIINMFDTGSKVHENAAANTNIKPKNLYQLIDSHEPGSKVHENAAGNTSIDQDDLAELINQNKKGSKVHENAAGNSSINPDDLSTLINWHDLGSLVHWRAANNPKIKPEDLDRIKPYLKKPEEEHIEGNNEKEDSNQSIDESAPLYIPWGNKPTRPKVKLSDKDEKAYRYIYLMYNNLIEKKLNNAGLGGNFLSTAHSKIIPEIFKAATVHDTSKSKFNSHINTVIDGAIKNIISNNRRPYVTSQHDIKSKVFNRENKNENTTDNAPNINLSASDNNTIASVVGQQGAEEGNANLSGAVTATPAQIFRQNNPAFINSERAKMGTPGTPKIQSQTASDKPPEQAKLNKEQSERLKAINAAKGK
jgi:hypothetical protein